VCLSADAARFNCENSRVKVGDRNVCLKCEIRAQPRLTTLFWIIDDNGTTVYEGEVVDRYWMLILVRYLRGYSNCDSSTSRVRVECDSRARFDYEGVRDAYDSSTIQHPTTSYESNLKNLKTIYKAPVSGAESEALGYRYARRHRLLRISQF